ncbi:copper chaperone PCu(A)C [Eleftheria terrae]|uniref:copper chaperone PCu(A)C n=1 Tax=Eleftheria terrae TaxID=1597781 RepID=UPI00263B4DAF|nr:copper chaperone PCu(A)C [Eleftheria terrae]WKB52881.1 copper chaperone PCu(A)C [Eleftheria terrae]
MKTSFHALLASCALALCTRANAATPIQVHAPWARPTVAGQTSGGGFLTLENQGPTADKLVGAATPVAGSTELHSMKMEGPVMRMRHVEAIDLPAGQKVELKPGGLHVMFFGLKAPLKAGDTVPLTLRFEKAGEVTVQMKVGAPAADAPRTGHSAHSH